MDSGTVYLAHQPLEHEKIMCKLFYEFTMLHTSVMTREGEFDKQDMNCYLSFRISQDHDVWTRRIRVLRFTNLHSPLLKIRKRENKLGRTRKPIQQELSHSFRARQLNDFGLAVTSQVMQLFYEHQSRASKRAIRDCQEFESLLLDICATELALLFEREMLMGMVGALIRALCSELLRPGNLQAVTTGAR